MDAEIDKCFHCGKTLQEERNIKAYCSVECVHKQARGEDRIRDLEHRVETLEQGIQKLNCECGIPLSDIESTHALYCGKIMNEETE